MLRSGVAGFTLVEVLVVLAIIAIAAAVAVVAYDGNDRDRANREARRFAGALEHAAARAQARSETLGASASAVSGLGAAAEGPPQAAADTPSRRRKSRAFTMQSFSVS